MYFFSSIVMTTSVGLYCNCTAAIDPTSILLYEKVMCTNYSYGWLCDVLLGRSHNSEYDIYT